VDHSTPTSQGREIGLQARIAELEASLEDACLEHKAEMEEARTSPSRSRDAGSSTGMASINLDPPESGAMQALQARLSQMGLVEMETRVTLQRQQAALDAAETQAGELRHSLQAAKDRLLQSDQEAQRMQEALAETTQSACKQEASDEEVRKLRRELQVANEKAAKRTGGLQAGLRSLQNSHTAVEAAWTKQIRLRKAARAVSVVDTRCSAI